MLILFQQVGCYKVVNNNSFLVILHTSLLYINNESPLSRQELQSYIDKRLSIKRRHRTRRLPDTTKLDIAKIWIFIWEPIFFRQILDKACKKHTAFLGVWKSNHYFCINFFWGSFRKGMMVFHDGRLKRSLFVIRQIYFLYWIFCFLFFFTPPCCDNMEEFFGSSPVALAVSSIHAFCVSSLWKAQCLCLWGKAERTAV